MTPRTLPNGSTTDAVTKPAGPHDVTGVRRGQADGTFDRALAPDWLLGVFFALLHAAAEQRLHGAADDPLADGLVATILKAFGPAAAARGDQTPAA